MALVTNILSVILFLAGIALCVFLIIYLKRIVVSVEKLQKDMDKLTDETVPILKNIAEVTQKANRITDEAEKHWNDLENAIQNVRDRFSRLTHKPSDGSAENTGRDFVRNISALIKGITAFWSKWRQ